MTLKSYYSQNRLGEKTQWFTLIESQAMAADLASGIQDGPWAFGLLIEIITADGASTPNYQPRIRTADDDGNVINLWAAAAAITTDTTTTYLFFPGGAADMDGITEGADMPVPRQWELFLDKTTGSFTVEVHACYL